MVHMSTLRCHYDPLRVQLHHLYPKCSQTDPNRTLFSDSVVGKSKATWFTNFKKSLINIHLMTEHLFSFYDYVLIFFL